MRTISRKALAIVAGNPNFAVFSVGFSLCFGALATYSAQLSGVLAGLTLMVIAAFPFLMAWKGAGKG